MRPFIINYSYNLGTISFQGESQKPKTMRKDTIHRSLQEPELWERRRRRGEGAKGDSETLGRHRKLATQRMGSSRKLIAAIAGLGAVGAVCVITFAAVMLSAPRDTSELLSLPDFTVSHQVLSVLGMHPASTHTRVNRWQRSTSSAQLPARAPKDQRDRNVKATLKEISQLKENLASMSRRDRDVVLRLEKRRLALTHCDSVGCRAAPPLVWRERKMLSQLASPTRSSSSSSSSSSDEDGEEPEQDGEEGGGEEGNEDASGEEPEQDGEEPEQDGEEGEETREEGEGPEEHKEKIRNVYRTSGGGQSPKGVGTARIGDPVLNKHDKSIYRRRCENDFDCVTDGWETMSDDYEDDHAHKERQRLWRRTRQLDRSIDISANQDMKEQMTELMRDTERSVHECKKYFRVVSSDAVAACERRAVRHTCYIFEVTC